MPCHSLIDIIVMLELNTTSTPALITVLWGNLPNIRKISNLNKKRLKYITKRNQNTKRLTEVKSRLEWFDLYRSKCIHYTCGSHNTEVLKHYGAKNVYQITSKPFMAKGGIINNYYNKALMLKEIMMNHPKILFLDWDLRYTKLIDDNFWTRITENRPITNGEIKLPFVRYNISENYNDHNKHEGYMLQNSFMYCSNKLYIDNWVEDYQDDLSQKSEYMLTYSLIKRIKKFTPAEFVNIFDTKCVKTRFGFNDNKTDPYFVHHLRSKKVNDIKN
ncbi:MAG: hypothetical protein ACOC56_05680 [Atribacterota bacterium]